MKFLYLALLSVTLSYSLTPSTCFSWGGKGHHSICEAAVHLVEDPDLKAFLKTRSHTLGHLCNVPDIYWKSISPETRKVGDPTHYIDPEILGLKMNQLPTDYQEIVTKYTGTDNQFNSGLKISHIPHELGSVWWRIEQFYNRSVEQLKTVQTSTPPEKRPEEQNDQLPFNQAAYNSLVNMGLMGHFVGDATQPYHVTSDYDGYKQGHGGIHAFYEEEVISYFDENLIPLIVTAGKAIKKDLSHKKKPHFLNTKSIVKASQLMSWDSYSEMPELLKKDKLITPSELKQEKGLMIKTQAARPSAQKMLVEFKPLIVKQLGRAALMLAHLWDKAYVEAKKPQTLTFYKSYRYPFTPDFVEPNYYVLPEKKKN